MLNRDFPSQAIAARQKAEQELGDLKVQAAELGAELNTLKHELKKVSAYCLNSYTIILRPRLPDFKACLKESKVGDTFKAKTFLSVWKAPCVRFMVLSQGITAVE